MWHNEAETPNANGERNGPQGPFGYGVAVQRICVIFGEMYAQYSDILIGSDGELAPSNELIRPRTKSAFSN